MEHTLTVSDSIRDYCIIKRDRYIAKLTVVIIIANNLGNMKSHFILMSLVLCATIKSTDSGAIEVLESIVRIGRLVLNVLGFGQNVADFFKPKADNSQDIDRILSELDNRITSAKTTIITTVLLQSKLEKIDEAVISIGSSLTDLQNILEANGTLERQSYENDFVFRFQGVIKYLRFLPELLTYTIPGSPQSLMDLYTKNSRCNMTAIYELEWFYYNLVSDGVALEFAYILLTSNTSIARTQSWWINEITKMNETFIDQENACKQQFVKLAKEDMESADNALALWESNKQRYPWMKNHVFFLPPFGTYQFLYMKYDDAVLIWNEKRSNKNKIVIFTESNDWVADPHILSTAEVKADLKKSIKDTADTDAAYHIAEKAEWYLQNAGIFVKALIVFFDGDNFRSEGIQFDNDTQLLYSEVEDVELTYCYETLVACTIDPLNWFDKTKTVHGKMKIVAYVGQNAVKNPKTSATQVLYPAAAILAFGVLSAIMLGFVQ